MIYLSAIILCLSCVYQVFFKNFHVRQNVCMTVARINDKGVPHAHCGQITLYGYHRKHWVVCTDTRKGSDTSVARLTRQSV